MEYMLYDMEGIAVIRKSWSVWKTELCEEKKWIKNMCQFTVCKNAIAGLHSPKRLYEDKLKEEENGMAN